MRKTRISAAARRAAVAATVVLAGAVGALTVAPAAHAENGADFHSVKVDCDSTRFYRNYNPYTDDFSDPVGDPYTRDQLVNIRNDHERSGPRGVRGYENMWGWFSRNCLAGYH